MTSIFQKCVGWLIILLLFDAATAVTAQSVLHDSISANDFITRNRKLSSPVAGEIQLDEQNGSGVAWYKPGHFENGVIECDIRGNDQFQKSFTGIYFHGSNDSTFEVIYLRPFNFRSKDPGRRAHAVQYVAEPKFDWPLLREKYPGQYEKGILPAPDPTEWFHVKIEVANGEIRVFVNHDGSPCLTIHSIVSLGGNQIGFWVGNGSGGRFRSFTIKSNSRIARYQLPELLRQKKLEAGPGLSPVTLQDSAHAGIQVTGVAWLSDMQFTTGTIDVDLRGKNAFLQSFLGIAFHGTDSSHLDLIYFRPFNFQYPDTARRRWSLQYMSLPDYSYEKLRKQHPLQYENSIVPAPSPDEWFHASIVVTRDSIFVFVNRATIPSLQVKMLGAADGKKIGLWANTLPGDFADLTVMPTDD